MTKTISFIVLYFNNTFELEDGSNIYELAKSLSQNLAKSAVVGEVNGTLVDLVYKLKDNDEVNILTYEDEKTIEVMRHSTSHIMAQAVKRVFKDVKLAIGPSIENGFYYDFDCESISSEDISKIENIDNFIFYDPKLDKFDTDKAFQSGAFLTEINIENVEINNECFGYLSI